MLPPMFFIYYHKNKKSQSNAPSPCQEEGGGEVKKSR